VVNVKTKKKTKKPDRFAASEHEVEDARGVIEEALQQMKEDPILRKLDSWGVKIDGNEKPFDLVRNGDPLVMLPAKNATEARRKESIIFGPDVMASPRGDASTLALYKAETNGLSGYGESVIGLGSTDFMELLRVTNWMLLHNPLAKNVIRALTYLTVGQGVTVTWPGDRKGNGAKREKVWKAIERTTKFQRQVRRIATMTFGFGEWFTVPQYDKRKKGSPSLPNRLRESSRRLLHVLAQSHRLRERGLRLVEACRLPHVARPLRETVPETGRHVLDFLRVHR